MKKMSLLLLTGIFSFGIFAEGPTPNSKAIDEHEEMVKLEAKCEMKGDKKTGMIFFNRQCLKENEVAKIKNENLVMEPNKRELEGKLGQCTNTLDKVRRTEPRFLKEKLIKRILNDCVQEKKVSDNSQRSEKTTISETESDSSTPQATPSASQNK